jgi:regulatory protein
VAQLMQQRGLPAAQIDAALQPLRSTEGERAREVWRRKFGTPPVDLAERARQQRFLLARGFDAETIQRLMRDLKASALQGVADLDGETTDG